VTYCEKAPGGVLLYTKRQMAGLLQVSMRCLNEMMANGQISYLKIGGKLVRFRASHVLRRLKETSFVCRGKTDFTTENTETAEGDRLKAEL
jgi:excisionase family DNA binding protein